MECRPETCPDLRREVERSYREGYYRDGWECPRHSKDSEVTFPEWEIGGEG